MNKTVLVIDDDDMLRRTLAAGLRSEGFNVVTADSAEQGAQILDKLTVDAIVLDRMMTGRDGLGFLSDRRAMGDATPVIMLTALSGPENAIAGLDAGANDYLAKPFQLRELVLRLNNIVRKNDGAAQMPAGLVFADDEFFVRTPENPDAPRTLPLSGEEKKLLIHLTTPLGNIAPAAPMVAKRLRAKLNSVLSNIDIITIRGRGYKMVVLAPGTDNKDMA